MSIWLRLYTLGARLLIKPVFRRTGNAVRDGQRLDALAAMSMQLPPFSCVLDGTLGSRPARWILGRRAKPENGVLLYFHGGAYFAGSPRTHSAMVARLSGYAGIPAYLPDYRLTPEAPFPAAFEDALAAWDGLVAKGYRPEQIVIGGDSAGGGLALALLARLCELGQRPAGAFASSPWTDLTLSGESFTTQAEKDATLPAERMQEAADAYLDGAVPNDPRASPLFADFDTPPPVLLQVGCPEVLEDDSYRMADVLRRAGGEVDVQTWDGAPHVWHLGEFWVPEARAALRDCAKFIQTALVKARR